MSRIVLQGINKYYDKVHVLKDLNLTIEEGDFMTLLGPSGCGKTTTLRVIAGLENPQSGIITMDDNIVTNAEESYFAPSSKRGLNLVFQSYALWPHMTVFENVAFGLNVKKVPKEEVKERVKNALERMKIENFADRYPSELSGGQQQRVAIARAIVSEPKILLLDEPLSNLDAKLRIEMRAELKRLHQDLRTTIIYVTHDQVEALTLSTKIAIFFDGILVQVDIPKNIYNNPVNMQVADFIGNPKINFIDGVCKSDQGKLMVKSALGELIFDGSKGFLGSKEVILALRPEDIYIDTKQKAENIECRVYSVLPAGSETLIQLVVNNVQIMAKIIGQIEYEPDQKVWISYAEEKINVYEKATGRDIFEA
jgi:multiple sugar transport system ATP-binding protein